MTAFVHTTSATIDRMTESSVVTYTADCDDCGRDALWTATQRAIGNSLSVSCAHCGSADRPLADVVPLPPPEAPPRLVALWGPVARVG